MSDGFTGPPAGFSLPVVYRVGEREIGRNFPADLPSRGEEIAVLVDGQRRYFRVDRIRRHLADGGMTEESERFLIPREIWVQLIALEGGDPR